MNSCFKSEDLPTRNQIINSRTSAILAKDRTLFNGQPVVAVVGVSANAAEDGAERVDIEYELIESVVNLENALDPEGPIIFPNPGCSSK